jgi:hypothetical protein
MSTRSWSLCLDRAALIDQAAAYPRTSIDPARASDDAHPPRPYRRAVKDPVSSSPSRHRLAVARLWARPVLSVANGCGAQRSGRKCDLRSLPTGQRRDSPKKKGCICSPFSTGATGLEPATSGVTGQGSESEYPSKHGTKRRIHHPAITFLRRARLRSPPQVSGGSRHVSRRCERRVRGPGPTGSLLVLPALPLAIVLSRESRPALSSSRRRRPRPAGCVPSRRTPRWTGYRRPEATTRRSVGGRTA